MDRRPRSRIASAGSSGGRPSEYLVGVDLRHDDIGTVGLYHTVARSG